VLNDGRTTVERGDISRFEPLARSPLSRKRANDGFDGPRGDLIQVGDSALH
jgi:hypothetical protein